MTIAVMVAAGRGTRMGPNIDKLFLEVAGRPIVAHSWRRLDQAPSIGAIRVVVRDGMQVEFAKIAAEEGFQKPFELIAGGKERQDSVWNGLSGLPGGTEIVVIHDAARPCVSVDLIERTIVEARRHGAAVAAQRMTDTIKASDDGCTISEHLDRARLWSVQTPQTFRLEVIMAAMQAVRERGLAVTDDTAACALIGQSVRLVDSPVPNPKATSPSDLPYLEVLLGR